LLHINDLSYRIGGRVLFEGATAVVPKGHKVGLVGPNGSGKTTLFRLISGEVGADGGSVSVSGRARIGLVAQEAPSGTESLLATVLAADTELAALTAEADTATAPGRIAEVHERLAHIGAHTANSRAAAILAGLGFDEAAQARPCAEFSGGWRMRVALAGALFARPDLLLLDEPTNHLDLEAALWLESYLAAWDGTLLMISHDRGLLNRVPGSILHLHAHRFTRYEGGYDRFEAVRSENLSRQASMRTKQLAERRHMQAFVDRFRYKATKARQAQSRLKALARMAPIASVIEERTAPFHFPEPALLAPPLIAMQGTAVGYGETAVLSKLNLRLDMDDRIALLGANGNGKSTLVKLLAGRLHAMAGEITRSPKLRVGYFAQHQADELDTRATPLVELARHFERIADRRDEAPSEERLRGHLGRFGFGKAKAETPIGDLSGGEKARLLFGLMSLAAPHIMLIDEPTNHLDVDARAALVQALNAYQGAVVLVSHDAHLIEAVCDRLWLVDGGGCAPYDGDLAEYRDLVLRRAREVRRGARSAKTNGREGKKAGRKARAQARAETAALRKQGKAAERRVEALGQKKAALEAKLADPTLYDGAPGKVQALQIKLADIERAIAKAEKAWLEAEAKLAAASADGRAEG
jgi:ATP-binding cassette subfamily F protein 3